MLDGGEPRAAGRRGGRGRPRRSWTCTPFYAEGGGQIGDHGIIRTRDRRDPRGRTRSGPADTRSCTRASWSPGEVRAEQEAHGRGRRGRRREATARAHTSTHIVHWTLKHLLGEHARQAGSLVAPGRLRFDFPHSVGRRRTRSWRRPRLEANRRLALDDAGPDLRDDVRRGARRQGAVALFGEKYGDLVRVVEVGDYSRELCGGTHVHRTGNVSLIRILHEGSIGAGMRRVEALVGPGRAPRDQRGARAAPGLVETLGSTRSGLRRRPRPPARRARQTAGERAGQDPPGRRRRRSSTGIAEQVTEVDGARLVAALEDVDPDELRELAQKVVGKLEGNGGAAVVLGSTNGGQARIVAASSKRLVERGVTAPELLEVAAKQIGGGAGGKPILAFAGGPNAAAVKEAVAGIPARLAELLTGK